MEHGLGQEKPYQDMTASDVSTHIFQGDDVWVLSITQKDLYFICGVPLGFADDLESSQSDIYQHNAVAFC